MSDATCAVRNITATTPYREKSEISSAASGWLFRSVSSSEKVVTPAMNSETDTDTGNR